MNLCLRLPLWWHCRDFFLLPCATAGIWTHISRVAPTWDLLKDALLTELPNCVHLENLWMVTWCLASQWPEAEGRPASRASPDRPWWVWRTGRDVSARCRNRERYNSDALVLRCCNYFVYINIINALFFILPRPQLRISFLLLQTSFTISLPTPFTL